MSNEISMLLRRQLKEIRGAQPGSDCVTFVTDSGSEFQMYHAPDCCETVELNEVIGDIDDLIGSPILLAECVTNNTDDPPEYAESFTWTFYKLATHKGHVTFRWLGESSGYYSEEVAFGLFRLSKADFFAHECGALRLPYKEVDHLVVDY